MVGRRLASALSWRYFPAGHHQLQRSRPTVDPVVPSSPSNALEVHAPPHIVGLYPIVSDREKAYRTARAGDLGAGIAQKMFFFKSQVYNVFFPTIIDPADCAVGPLSALPYQALHGYGVFSAHHGEVRGCRRACEHTLLALASRCIVLMYKVATCHSST
jgi:hypothetical protein